MTCNCHKRHDAELDFSKRPTEPCYLCAEKHIATAAALVRENGYESANRVMLIGELVLAQWHLWNLDRRLAEAVRDTREHLHSGEPFDIDAIAARVSEAASQNSRTGKYNGKGTTPCKN